MRSTRGVRTGDGDGADGDVAQCLQLLIAQLIRLISDRPGPAFAAPRTCNDTARVLLAG